MARLNKAQREAKDEKRPTVAAQATADAKATSPASDSGTTASRSLPVDQPSLQASSSAVHDTEGSIALTPRRSPSILSEVGAGPPSVSASSAVGPGNIGASGSKSPLGGPLSDMSTSDESDNDEGGKDKSIGNDTLQDVSEAALDEDDELSGTANGPSPEVRCMWEDCGQVFTTLAPFITHLHDGKYLTLALQFVMLLTVSIFTFQITLGYTKQDMHASGLDVREKARCKRVALPYSVIYVVIREKSPLHVLDLVCPQSLLGADM